MKNRALFLSLLGILFSFCAPTFAQSVVIPILTNAGTLDSTTYRCDKMVQSINQLRHLGKEQALKVLKAELKENKDDIKIMCICRLLFENPQGWKPIAGSDMYSEMVYTNVLERFPLFPIAMSDGVPFFIYRGFQIDGRLAEGGQEDLQLCGGFTLIPADLPHEDYDKAALKLILSDPFLKLYKVRDYAKADYTKDLVYEILWETGVCDR